LQLDSFTILVSGTAVLVLQGLVFLFFWFRDRSATAMLLWGLPFVLGGIAVMLYARPGWNHDFLSIAIGNAVRMVVVVCLWQGIRVFQGRKGQLWVAALVGAGWIGLCLFPPFFESMWARVVTVSLINAALCVAAVHELWRDRSEHLPSRRPLMLVFTSFGAIMLFRAAAAAVMPFPFGAEAADPTWVGAFVLLVFGHVAFAAILFFAMTRERREAEQRSFALSDPLTGLLNRRAFGDFAERMGRRRASVRSATALLVLDLDHFKEVNDRFGHETGDRMLKSFADVAEGCMRPTDQLFRMGGEEFCFVLPETALADAVAVAERVRRSFEATQVETPHGPASATVSIGIAATHFAVSIEVLLAAADAAVYEAKARGRNRVVVAEPGSLVRSDLADIPAAARLRA
jgi:diguanylate cyclase (GGDEF)-like protein